MLYDEVHPLGEDIGLIQTQDIARKPDMLIIMGTSLKVHGLKKLVKDFAKAVHASKTSVTGTSRSAKNWQGKVIFVNKTPPGSEWEDVIDYHVSGETDSWVQNVLEDWKKMRPSDWEVQQTLDDDDVFKVTKGSASVVTQKKCTYSILTSHTLFIVCYSRVQAEIIRGEWPSGRDRLFAYPSLQNYIKCTIVTS